MTWVHWVLYDIPADHDGAARGQSSALPAGTREGINDWKRTGYGGRARRSAATATSTSSMPSTPSSAISRSPRKAALEKAMKGHVLAEAELVGTYEKGQP